MSAFGGVVQIEEWDEDDQPDEAEVEFAMGRWTIATDGSPADPERYWDWK